MVIIEPAIMPIRKRLKNFMSVSFRKVILLYLAPRHQNLIFVTFADGQGSRGRSIEAAFAEDALVFLVGADPEMFPFQGEDIDWAEGNKLGGQGRGKSLLININSDKDTHLFNSIYL
jgi:hypothetical protein